MIFALGPYQAGNNPGNAKWTVVSKSPLTGTFADSAAGGSWGLALKKAGYDALVITGQSHTPVYLVIDEDRVKIIEANELWGSDIYVVTQKLKKTYKNCAVATIGPAGEKLVRFACIAADGHSFAGRCGLGAVMGSKKLKAIVIIQRGKTPPLHDERTLTQVSRKLFRQIYLASKEHLRLHGTPELCVTAESVGDMPIKYWTGDVWSEGARKLGTPAYTARLHARPLPCVNCPIGCHRYVEVKTLYGEVVGPGPEYETLGMLGTNLLVDDLMAIAYANELCNRFGIDTITAGACVGLAMECYEHGLLSKKETGVELIWGNSTAMIEMIKALGTRTGFLGELFANGTLAAARQIHPAAEDLVVHVKGLDYPAHDPRACFSLAVNYATGTRGACHVRGVTEDVELGAFFVPELGIVPGWAEFFSTRNKTELTIKLQDLCAWLNSLVVCLFMMDGGGLTLSQLLVMFNSITGWDWDISDVMKAGATIFTMQRVVNIRDGHSCKTDTFPSKMRIPASSGFRLGQIPPFEMLLKEYYEQRGWSKDGIPKESALKQLGLEFLITFLESPS